MSELPVVLLPVGAYRLVVPARCLLRFVERPLLESKHGNDYVHCQNALWPLLTPSFVGAGQSDSNHRSENQHSIRIAIINHEACRFALRVLGIPETGYLRQGQLRLRRDIVPGIFATGAYEWGTETVLLPSLSAIAQALEQ